ncbi:xanthine dehydrogenase family protein molybdopterin-binding subunit [Pseudotabrizicola alkalilacus]|uniref:Xanthine dehydrogenase family protein molybdopterin-binding subunit n=1 Tax=Pseudotabrizicola alkalilacus TaxID=2305252 RepID=A0A411Z334_9RHOB|nr:xanthine dehydrogenase family protein molybdopterin-binding subunit [Pseudotabrizicola alkalilacus]RGP37473.1 xanthine dehydrogenase family protein molybdopterin-binding subunit [Pseudotabrizicola alkalilacus]
MTRHLKVDAPIPDSPLDHMAQGVLGKPVSRLEGPLKVTGRATYAAEARPEGLLYGVLVQAAIPAGKVLSIGDAPGAMVVIHDPRLIRYAAQGMATEGPTAGPDEVEYMGQAIAVVVAEALEAAQAAAQALQVTYEAKDVPVDPEAVEPERPEDKQSATGDLDRAMQDASHTLDQIWHTPSHTAAAMEPHAATAEWSGDTLTVRAGYQMLATSREQLADAVGIKPDQVRLLAPYVGGGFGSKLGINADSVAAAIAAQQLGRPVQVVMTRQQVFDLAHRRSETRQRIRLACDTQGKLTGIGHEALVSNLPGVSFSEPVTQATPFTYQAAHRQIVHAIARVHRSCAGSVRAPGEAVGATVFECAMDELAETAGIDPVELRLRNIPDTEPCTGRPFSSHKLAEALREGAARFNWSDRRPTGQRREGDWYIGMGVASAVRVNSLIESRARVTLQADGRAIVETDMTDIGTGSYTILGQIAAETLGLAVDRVEVRLGDSDFPPASGSGGSFGAASSGTSVYLACAEIRSQIAALIGCDEADLTLQNGQVRTGNVSRPLDALLTGELTGDGHLEPGKTEDTVRQATWGSHWAEIAVNRWTGEVRVRRMLGVFACGRVLNEKTARSQCLGGMTFGLGMALTEAMAHDPRDGHIVTRDLAEYHIPCHADVPPLEVHFLTESDTYVGPLHAKGLGELGICGAGAAILNAIHNACGVRVRELPATPDKIIAGLQS